MEEPRARMDTVVPAPGDVPGEPDARLDLRRERIAEAARHAVARVDHPVVLVTRPGHVGADEDLVQRLVRSPDRTPTRDAVDERRLIEPRRPGRIEARRVEVRDLVVHAPVGLVPQEHARRSRR